MKDYVVNSKLIDEWNWDKNSAIGIYPDKITLGSGKKFGGLAKMGMNIKCQYIEEKKIAIIVHIVLERKFLLGLMI